MLFWHQTKERIEEQRFFSQFYLIWFFYSRPPDVLTLNFNPTNECPPRVCLFDIINTNSAAVVAQLVEWSNRKPDNTGSKPVSGKFDVIAFTITC